MFFVRCPPDSRVRALLDAARDQPFGYDAVGATAGEPPPGFTVDRWGAELGAGEATYARAKAAVAGLGMYPPGWTRVVADPGPIAEGFAFAALIRHLGFWSVNPCRVIYTIDDSDGGLRSGFGFGTLPGHAELGEERFEVHYDPASDRVAYSVVAFSRPHAVLARLGAPIARAYQRRFQRDSCEAMKRAAATTPEP